jgi:MFS family permease
MPRAGVKENLRLNSPLPPDASEPEETPPADERPRLADTRVGFTSVLRNRAFLCIWLAQVASQTAQNTLWYALIVLVSNSSGQSPVSIGLTIILVQLPTVFFSSVSGVLVDRMPKNVILVGTNAIRVVGVFGYLLFQRDVGVLYAITFAVAVVSQPFAPAEGATLPLLVDREELITANSLFQLTFMASQAVGYAVGSLAIGLLGMDRTLIILACLFAFAAAVLVPLPQVTKQRATGPALSFTDLLHRVARDLHEVVVFVFRDPPLAVALLQIAIAPTLLLVLAEVGPSFLAHTLQVGQTSTALFLLLAPAGAGLACGMVILGHWGYRLRKDKLVLVSLLALGVTVIGLASVPTIAQYWQGLGAVGIHFPRGVQLLATVMPITALLGIEVAFVNAPVQTIVQQRAKPELRGRVLALQQTLTAAMAIPPLILVGGVAALVGTPATLSLMGVVLLGIGLVIVYYS